MGNALAKRPAASELLQAAYDGNLSRVKRLLKKGADVNAQDEYGMSSLFAAARYGHTAVVELLLKSGANPDLQEERGWNSLLVAAWLGHTAVVELLLKSGANPDLQDENGMTPLDVALLRKNMSAALLLIEYGANVDHVDQSSQAQKIFEGKLSQQVLEQAGPFLDSSSVEASVLESVNTVKAVMLGEVRAGKTSIVKSLEQKETYLTDEGEDGRTVGVDLFEITVDKDKLLIVYDFGGHESYFYCHQLFVSSQTLYLIVTDSTNFKISDCDRTLTWWFESVSSRGVKPVFMIICSKAENLDAVQKSVLEKQIIDHLKTLSMVQTKSLEEMLGRLESDEENKDLSEERIKRIRLLLENRPILPEEVVFVTVKDKESLNNLEKLISETISKQSNNLPSMKIPKKWIMILKELQKRSEYINFTEFQKMCVEKNVVEISEVKSVLRYLCDVGKVLYYGAFSFAFEEDASDRKVQRRTFSVSRHQMENDLSNTIFTRPAWLSEILGKLYHHRLNCDNPLDFIAQNPAFCKETDEEKKIVSQHLKNGVMTKNTISCLIGDMVEKKMVPTVLELFQKLDVCYEIKANEYNYEKDVYCFPAFLKHECREIECLWPSNCPSNMKEFVLIISSNTLSIPTGFFLKISVRLNELLSNRRNWKDCIISDVGDKNAQIKMELKGRSIWVNLRVLDEDREYGRVVLLWVVSTIRYVTLFYPTILFSIHVACSKCVTQTWPIEKFTNPKARNVILRCEGNPHDPIRVQDVFPLAVEMMEESKKEAIRHCMADLVSDLAIQEMLYLYLEQEGVFTSEVIEEIKAAGVRDAQARQMLSNLGRRPASAFDKFCFCLNETGQQHLADRLQRKELEFRAIGGRRAGTTEASGVLSSPDISSVSTHHPGTSGVLSSPHISTMSTHHPATTLPEVGGREESHRAAIRSCHVELVNDLHPSATLFSHLEQRGVFSTTEIEYIQGAGFRAEVVRRILTELSRKSSAEFDKFCMCLDETGQKHLTDRLRQEEGN